MREKLAGSEDIAFIHSATEDGQGTRILRLRKGKVEAAEVRPVKEGQAIKSQEVVRLHPRETMPRICDVEVLHTPVEDESVSEQNGPARVSTKAYRENWDRIFTSESTADDERPEDDWNIN
jgi:hypothetical protein